MESSKPLVNVVCRPAHVSHGSGSDRSGIVRLTKADESEDGADPEKDVVLSGSSLDVPLPSRVSMASDGHPSLVHLQ